MNGISGFFRKEKVFTISLVLALISLPLNMGGAPYLQYIDTSVIMLLFSLMGVVAGFRSLGAFDAMARVLLARGRNVRRMALIFMSLCFFMSMLVTNDVALITFVPLTISALSLAAPEAIVPIVVLETIAANLGSMATPMGNPQNLYIYTAFGLSPADFLRIMLPLTALSLVLLMLCCFRFKARPLELSADKPIPLPDDLGWCGKNTLTWVYGTLGIICLLALFKVLPKSVCCGAVLVGLGIFSPRVLRRIDYALLATFAFFFIFVGNIGALPAVDGFLRGAINGRELPLGALLSQVISNVPATFMLAPFAQDIPALLKGVNIGGLGTPVASLASLISLKLYSQSAGADAGRFMKLFLILNFAFLAVLILATYII